ncbi:MAG: hypothetical protein NXI31_25425 [bacterium]|nr:hypothetical protein [bacterium]
MPALLLLILLDSLTAQQDASTAARPGLMPLAIGSTVSWQFALPSWLDPVAFRFQDWLLDGALFESTERLDVPVTK